MKDYRDRNGLAFADLWRSLPSRTADWPKPPRNTTDTEAMEQFHADFSRTNCWFCGERTGTELHHLGAGSRGRAHERALFCWACSLCHREHVGEGDLARWLLAKWKHDKQHVDWLWLTIRLGYFPPELK